MEEDLGVDEGLALDEKEDLEEFFLEELVLWLDMEPRLRNLPPLLLLTGAVERGISSTMIVFWGSDDEEGSEEREVIVD